MATAIGSYLCDSSTLANFKAWAQAISAALGTTAGWVQSSDTGQVNWSTISAVPGSSSFVYEMWKPNDGLANFYLKVEYGNSSSSNGPAVRLTVGTMTDGAGNLTGNVVGPFYTTGNTVTTGTTPPYECRFSGAPGRFAAMLWRLGAGNSPQFFAVERSVDSTGAYTASHVTLIAGGGQAGGGGNSAAVAQQTLHLSLGPAPATSVFGSPQGGLGVRTFSNQGASGVFNGSVAFETVSPYVGYFDFPLTCVGLGNSTAYLEGQVFAATLYGTSRTYIATQSSRLASFGGVNTTISLCMRYD
jgi:hypothetical protein